MCVIAPAALTARLVCRQIRTSLAVILVFNFSFLFSLTYNDELRRTVVCLSGFPFLEMIMLNSVSRFGILTKCAQNSLELRSCVKVEVDVLGSRP